MRFDYGCVSTVCHLAQSLAPDILSPSRWEYERILRVPAICGPTLQWLTDSARDLPISMECAGRGYVMALTKLFHDQAQIAVTVARRFLSAE
jgi:hypothetical protein